VKVFWSFIAVLVIATVVVFVVKLSPGENPHPAEGSRSSATLSQRERVRTSAEDRQLTLQDEAESQSSPIDEPIPESALARRVRTDHEHQAGAAVAPAAGGPVYDGDFLAFLGLKDDTGVAEVTPEQRAKDEASKQAHVAQLQGGGIEIDERFTVRGKGSEREPFAVPWELLMSAREVYVPREDRKIIPGRISMLEGTRVRLEGYLMLPMVRDDVREFVVMQNQWDGCCIGIPPTPYDVSLNEPIDFGFGMRQSATVTGRMVIDPFIFGSGTLLGLYSIEDAKIEVTEW